MSDVRCSLRWSLAAVLGLLGCGDDEGGTDVDASGATTDGSAADAAAGAPPDATADAGGLVCAAYPIPVSVSGSTEEVALAELETLSETAQLTWSEARGTLASIFQLDLPLPACIDGADANTVVRDVLVAHPMLFRFDSDEWYAMEPFNCMFVGDFSTVTMGRKLLGGHPVARDIFAYTLRRDEDGVRLASVVATYLPPVGDAVGAAMTSCQHLDAAQAEATVRASTLTAATFEQCVPTGEVQYQPQRDDSYVLLDDTAWLWDETEAGMFLTATRTLRLTLDPSNHTPELLSSEARCPVLDGPSGAFTVGFDVRFDVETGEVINVKPGLDCIVC